MGTTFVKFEDPHKKRKSVVPVTIPWKNATMVREHSIRATVKEILNLSKALDVVKINIIGNPSTGKTTLADTIGHLGHELADIPYTVKKYSKEDLLDFKATLAKLQPTNHILIFDDISFLTASASGKQIKQIEQAFTEIRHLPGGQDVKIIAIFNFHYNMGLSKYLRQSDFIYYTSIGSSELENTQNIVGKKNTNKILDFRKAYQESVTKGVYKVEFAKSGRKFPYKFRQPFAPLFFWNNTTARIVVFPKRQWIDPTCKTCDNSGVVDIKSSGDLKKLNEKLESEFTHHTIIQAMKITLFNMGVSTFPRTVKRCMTLISNELKQNQCSVGQMAQFYNLESKPGQYQPPKSKGRLWTGIND